MTAVGELRVPRRPVREGGFQRTNRDATAGPERYRFVMTAIDAAGNRSAPRTISFTILSATR